MSEKKKERRQSARKANRRYDVKTYKSFLVKLRKEDDADILKYIELAKQDGKSNREWLRVLFEKSLVNIGDLEDPEVEDEETDIDI